MKIYTGKSVMQGIAVGKIYLYEKKKYRQEKKTNVRPGEKIIDLKRQEKMRSISWRSLGRKPL